MRTLDKTSKHTEVQVLDEKGQGNANHEYQIVNHTGLHNEEGAVLGIISFQNGPIKEFGVNGVTNEDLLAIVIDQLRGFQLGDFACDDNQRALVCVESALTALFNRTAEREVRGVEGTLTI